MGDDLYNIANYSSLLGYGNNRGIPGLDWGYSNRLNTLNNIKPALAFNPYNFTIGDNWFIPNNELNSISNINLRQGNSSIWGNAFGKNGWANTALGLLQSLASGFLGMKQYGLAKKSLKQSREQFNKNYAAAASMANRDMEDRQKARLAANPNAHESVEDYMKKHRIA